jgi:predicted acyl esterase
MPGNGWLRASHRKLDKEKSRFYRPWHTHDEFQPLKPGEIYELDVEIWPTCLVIPAGYRFGVTLTGCDFELDGPGPWPTVYGQIYRGNGCYQHTDNRDRPSAVFNNIISLFCDEKHPSSLLLPLIPPKEKLIG